MKLNSQTEDFHVGDDGAPVGLVEAIANLRLPAHADRQMQRLMDANINGDLTPTGFEQLESLVEWS